MDILGTTTATKHHQQQQPNNKHENGFSDQNDMSVKIKELQEEVNRLAVELSKLKEMRDTERTTNERLESEMVELKEKLKSKNESAMLEREKKIKELETQLQTAEEKYTKVQDESRHEQGERAENWICMRIGEQFSPNSFHAAVFFLGQLTLLHRKTQQSTQVRTTEERISAEIFRSIAAVAWNSDRTCCFTGEEKFRVVGAERQTFKSHARLDER